MAETRSRENRHDRRLGECSEPQQGRGNRIRGSDAWKRPWAGRLGGRGQDRGLCETGSSVIHHKEDRMEFVNGSIPNSHPRENSFFTAASLVCRPSPRMIIVK